jgi:soluble lytic murein transglycosylase
VVGLGSVLKVDENIFLLPAEWSRVVIPRGFQEMVDIESKNYNLENWKFYAIIKAESLFDPNAVSGAGARGLMQIMPATARGIAAQLRIDKYDLLEAAVSVKFGGQYMGWLERTFKGNYTDMVAAYNAGPGNLKKWRDQYAGADEDYFIEKIPFGETRFYVLRTGKFLETVRYFYNLKGGSD